MRARRGAEPAGQVQPAEPQLLLVVAVAPPQDDRDHPPRHDVGRRRARRRVDVERGGVPADDDVAEHVVGVVVLDLVDDRDRRDEPRIRPSTTRNDCRVGVQRAALAPGTRVVEVVERPARVPDEREDGGERVEEAGVAALAGPVRLGQLDG